MRLHLMGSSEVVSDEIRMCVHRRHPHTWETQIVFWFTRYHSRPDSEIQFVVLTSLPFHQTFGHWWPFLPESFHYISRSNGSQHSPADRFLPLSEPFPLFQSCKSAFCFRFFYVAAVKQKLARSEGIFTKESLFSVTLTAKARTHCWYSIVSSFVSLILSLDTVWRQISIWSNLVQFCKQDRHSFATAIGLSRKREIVI